jgi:ACT domain-containing protein
VSGPGYRIELVLQNRPGKLLELLKLLKDFEANVVSVATAAHDDPDKIINILRIETRNYKLVKAAIKKSGFELLSAD